MCPLSLIAWTPTLLSSGVQVSVFSDVFVRIESGFNHFNVQPSAPRVATVSLERTKQTS